MPRTRTAPTAAEREQSNNDAVRLRAARAAFVSAIGAAMLANVAAGIAPPWNKTAPREWVARWDAFDHLSGLLLQATDRNVGISPAAQVRELAELLAEASSYLPAAVIQAGYTLGATIEAIARD